MFMSGLSCILIIMIKYVLLRDDLMRAIKKLKVMGNGFGMIPVGGSYLVQSVPAELNMDHTVVLQLAEVTCSSWVHGLRFGRGRATLAMFLLCIYLQSSHNIDKRYILSDYICGRHFRMSIQLQQFCCCSFEVLLLHKVRPEIFILSFRCKKKVISTTL